MIDFNKELRVYLGNYTPPKWYWRLYWFFFKPRGYKKKWIRVMRYKAEIEGVRRVHHLASQPNYLLNRIKKDKDWKGGTYYVPKNTP